MKKSFFFVLPLLLASLSGCNKGGYTFDDVSNENGSMSYEIFVRSFYDTDGDEIGDLNGVTAKLPYLYDLGIKTVWLMPIQKSPSYHGYDVSNYYTVNSQYGTLDDFDNLVNEAKKYNIDIMLDMVFNHCSVKHKYFTQSYEDYINGNTAADSKADWFNWSDTKYTGYNKYNDLYYESNFDASMPDFNLDSEGVRNEIENIMKFWIQDHGVKGFRLDAVLYYYMHNTTKNVEFLSFLEDTAHKYDPNFYMVGEAWDDADTVNDYHKSKLDSFFRFETAIGGDYYSFVNLTKGYIGSDRIKQIENNEAEIKANNHNGYASYFLSNHDQDRISGSFNEDQSKVAASILCLMPGTPFMYYGEEIMLQGKRTKDQMTDAMRRLPMKWSKTDKTGECKYPEKNSSYLWDGAQVELGVNDQLKDGYSLVNHYKKVINIRNKYPFLKHGVFTSLMGGITEDGIVAYKIALGDEYINIYHNVTDEAITFTAKGSAIVDEINTSKTAPKLDGDKLTLAPRSSAILK